MTCQTFKACKLPVAVGKDADGQYHLYHTLKRRQEIIGLIEEAMAQTGSYQDACKAIEKQGFKEFCLQALLPIQFLDQQIGQEQPYKPQQAIPAQHTKKGELRVPINIQYTVHEHDGLKM